jgi:hypothetical protein
MDNPDLLDSGFIYRPNRISTADGEDWTHAPGSCVASVRSEDTYFSHQCSRKAKVEREVIYHGKPVRFSYCAIHDPAAVKKRQDARLAKWRAKWDAARQAAKDREAAANLREAALEGLKAIANGHNDPMTLAREILAEHREQNDGR